MTNLDSILKSFANKGLFSQSYGFSSSHVWMWELDYNEGWMPKNWHFWTLVLEKTLESLLDSKEIKTVNPKGNQPWIFIGRTDAEVEAPILWPCDAKSWFIGKDPGKRCWEKLRAREKGNGWEDEMVGWHHWLNGCESEQTHGNSDGKRSLACCNTWVAQSQTPLSNWTTTKVPTNCVCVC